MRKHIHIQFPILYIVLCSMLCGCGDSETAESTQSTGTTLRLRHGYFATGRAVDADNLAVEQTVVNMAVMLTAPSADQISHSFIDAGFSTVDDYKLVSLPADADQLGQRDIYVVTNYSPGSLDGITSVSQLKELYTPLIDKNNNLDPAKGICMFGKLMDFDFANAAGDDAEVTVRRTCAKLRITLTFPEDPELGTDNTFLIAHAATYTHVYDDVTGFIIPSDSYFNYAAPLPLQSDGAGGYTAVTYIYEATQVPSLYIYTTISGTREEFSTELFLPLRNYLYDLDIRVYEAEGTDQNTSVSRTMSGGGQTISVPGYRLEVNLHTTR